MRVVSLQLQNYRAYVATEPIELGPINVLIGANNAGKSCLLRALYLLQDGSPNQPLLELRRGAGNWRVSIALADIDTSAAWPNLTHGLSAMFVADFGADGSARYRIESAGGTTLAEGQRPGSAPNHFVVPFFSKRKVTQYSEDIRLQHADLVGTNFTYLPAKLSRLRDDTYPFSESYTGACKAILGFVVTVVPSLNGLHPAGYLADGQSIPLDQMGDGVPNIVGLLADLAVSKGKLFLMEEPENDLHPKALKALLDLIVESAELNQNQFVVSTHSNIVARHLGAAPESRLYEVRAEHGAMPPESTVRLLATTEERLEALRDLGYALSDFDLWDGWLILEESSAERIILHYLIPNFAPKLSRVRTLASGGSSTVEPTFADFHRLFLFAHLEDAYRDAAWVRIDGDTEGRRIVGELQKKYAGWSPDRFACFSEPQFERYYPVHFSSDVERTLAVQDKQELRTAKRELLGRVVEWLDADPTRAREALSESARAVIDDLRRIEGQLMSRVHPNGSTELAAEVARSVASATKSSKDDAALIRAQALPGSRRPRAKR